MIVDGQSLLAITRMPGMPGRTCIFRWLSERSEFENNYARATEIRAHVGFDEIQEIADHGSGDVNRDRLRIDTMKWRLARMVPRKYGKRIATEISASVNADVAVEREALIAEILKFIPPAVPSREFPDAASGTRP